MLSPVSAREAFHVLLHERSALPTPTLQEAHARTFQIGYDGYRDNVLEYLAPDDRARYEGAPMWDQLCLTAAELIDQVLAIPEADEAGGEREGAGV